MMARSRSSSARSRWWRGDGARWSLTRSGGWAVVLVGGAADVVLCGPELAQRFGVVEHAGHAAAGEDLQKWVGDQVVGVFGVGQNSAGELVVGRVDAVPVGVCGWAADVFACGELTVVVGEVVEAGETVLVGVLVGEAGVVGHGVAKGDLDVQVAVLDRAGDEPTGAAHDVPGQRAPEPGPGDRAVWIGGDLLGRQALACG